jgi:putative ABC transport system permease protein
MHPTPRLREDFPPPQKKGIVRGYLDDIVFEVASAEETRTKRSSKFGVRSAKFTTSDPTDRTRFSIWDTMEGAKLVDKTIFNVITIFFGCVAGSPFA